MKTRIVVAVAVALVLLAGAAAYAQDVNTAIEFLRTDVKAKKQELMAKAMKLSEKEAEVFWPLYREFEAELTRIGDERIAVIKEYAANYETITDEKASALMKKLLATDQKRQNLREKYFKKMSKALSARHAVRFIQTETYLIRLVDLSIGGEVPLMPKPDEIK